MMKNVRISKLFWQLFCQFERKVVLLPTQEQQNS